MLVGIHQIFVSKAFVQLSIVCVFVFQGYEIVVGPTLAPRYDTILFFM